jgi:hypothetical protein
MKILIKFPVRLLQQWRELCSYVTTSNGARWCNGKAVDYYSGRGVAGFETLPGPPAILTEVFHGLTQSVQANVLIVRTAYYRILCYPKIRRHEVMIIKASSNKIRKTLRKTDGA